MVCPDGLIFRKNAQGQSEWIPIGEQTFYRWCKESGGSQLAGAVSLMTGNGSNMPFQANPPCSVQQICGMASRRRDQLAG